MRQQGVALVWLCPCHMFVFLGCMRAAAVAMTASGALGLLFVRIAVSSAT
jgi:hypothetical protein